MPRIALVIAAWEEAAAIGAVLAEVPTGVVDQVLVVVREPADATAGVARNAGARVLVQSGPGYGAACAEGARAAIADGAEILAFLDGDYSDPPSALPRVLAPLLTGTADLVLGCRDFARYPTALPTHARLGNALILAGLGCLLRTSPPRDLPSFKAIRSPALQHLALQETTYGWTVEMVVKAIRARYRIAEVMVPYRRRLGGRSKVSGTLRGTLGAAWKLGSCTVRYARWRPARSAQAGLWEASR